MPIIFSKASALLSDGCLSYLALNNLNFDGSDPPLIAFRTMLNLKGAIISDPDNYLGSNELSSKGAYIWQKPS